MRLARLLTALSLLALSLNCVAAEGLITLVSPHSPKVTMDRVEALVTERGLKVFARIDHAAGAASIGETLRPTELLIFGHPRGGTPFMACAQTVGIDLPLKVLVWEDAAGKVWLGYDDPNYIAKRHETPGCAAATNLSNTLAALAQAAIAQP